MSVPSCPATLHFQGFGEIPSVVQGGERVCNREPLEFIAEALLFAEIGKCETHAISSLPNIAD